MATIKAPADPAKKTKVAKASAAPTLAKAKKVASTEAKEVKPRKKKTTPQAITSEARTHMIAEAAYYLAEKNQFSGCTQSYWLAAEQAVHAQLTA